MATIRICNVDGCQSKYKALGYCRMHYEAMPARRAVKARANARHRERATGLSETTATPTHVTVPDVPQTDGEMQGRAILRYVMRALQATTTWDAEQYLVDLLCESQGVQVLRSSRKSA